MNSAYFTKQAEGDEMSSDKSYDVTERREGKPTVPSDLKQYLNADQMRRFNSMQSFGWKSYFIRRPNSQPPTIVMINNEGTHIAVLEDDGDFDTLTRVALRN